MLSGIFSGLHYCLFVKVQEPRIRSTAALSLFFIHQRRNESYYITLQNHCQQQFLNFFIYFIFYLYLYCYKCRNCSILHVGLKRLFVGLVRHLLCVSIDISFIKLIRPAKIANFARLYTLHMFFDANLIKNIGLNEAITSFRPILLYQYNNNGH